MSEPEIVAFDSPCPNGHQPTRQYAKKDLQRELADGTFRFFCVACGETWQPNAEERRNLERLAFGS
jgi:hypothetical protein